MMEQKSYKAQVKEAAKAEIDQLKSLIKQCKYIIKNNNIFIKNCQNRIHLIEVDFKKEFGIDLVKKTSSKKKTK